MFLNLFFRILNTDHIEIAAPYLENNKNENEEQAGHKD